MAAIKSKLKSGRRKVTSQQLADLKAAKKRGLTSIDLRLLQKDGISSSQRALAAKFRGLASGEIAVVSATSAAAKKYKAEGLTVVGTKILIPKTRPGDIVRFSKKTGELHKYHATQRVEIPILPSKMRALKKGESLRVAFSNRYGTTHKTFSDAQDMEDFLAGYPSDTKYLSIEPQIVLAPRSLLR
jgi:hypothetical protein